VQRRGEAGWVSNARSRSTSNWAEAVGGHERNEDQSAGPMHNGIVSHSAAGTERVEIESQAKENVLSANPAPDFIMQVGLGFWPSKILLSAVEMELFTDLAKGPQSLESIRGRLGLHRGRRAIFLDTLVALGLLARQDGQYSNTPATDLYLDKHKPSYLGGILEMANQRLYGYWNHLTEALRTGLPQTKRATARAPLFEAIFADPARLKSFLAAMTGLSHGANLAIRG